MRKLFAFVYLIMPSILVNAPYLSEFINNSFEKYVIAVYFISIIGIVLYFKYNLCNFYALFGGLLLSPLYSSGFATWAYITDSNF